MVGGGVGVCVCRDLRVEVSERGVGKRRRGGVIFFFVPFHTTFLMKVIHPPCVVGTPSYLLFACSIVLDYHY